MAIASHHATHPAESTAGHGSHPHTVISEHAEHRISTTSHLRARRVRKWLTLLVGIWASMRTKKNAGSAFEAKEIND